MELDNYLIGYQGYGRKSNSQEMGKYTVWYILTENFAFNSFGHLKFKVLISKIFVG